MQIRGRCSHRQTAGPRLRHLPRLHRRPTRLKRNCPAVPVPLSLGLSAELSREKSHEASQPKHLNPLAPLTCRGPMTRTHSPHPFSRKHSSKAIVRKQSCPEASIHPTPSSPPHLTPQPRAAPSPPSQSPLGKKKKEKNPGSAAIRTHLPSSLSPASPSSSHTHDTRRRTVFQTLGIGKDGPFLLTEKEKHKRTFKKKLYSHDSLARDRRLPSLYHAGPCPLACFPEDADGAVRESSSALAL
jgi:hypothetical protein